MELPPNFVRIKDIRARVFTQGCMGVITYIKEIRPSKGDDHVLQFSIKDDFSPEAYANELECKFFRQIEDMPTPGNIGDIVIIRNFKATRFRESLEIVSSPRDSATVTFFSRDKIPHPSSSTGYGVGGHKILPFHGTTIHKPTPQEQMGIITLKAAASPQISQVKLASTQRALTQRPFINRSSLIKDLEFDKFSDLVGEVVKFYANDQDSVDLYVTDYTTNKHLFLYENPETAEDPRLVASKNWKGPFGQVTLVIRAWEPHATFIKNSIKVGDVINIENVHVKLTGANKMEGALHQDTKYMDKIYIRICHSSEKIDALHKRKQEYELRYGIKEAREVLTRSDAYLKLGKDHQKRARKREDARVRHRIEQREMEEEEEEVDEHLSRPGSNSHIRAGYPNIKMSSVSEMLNNSGLKARGPTGAEVTLPFVNCKYRSRVRVVDFSPNSLEDFSHAMTNPAWNDTLDDSKSGQKRRDDRWQWGFVLLVEDADVAANATADRMLLFVAGPEADYLLRQKATDLRTDPTGMHMKVLEEKLFIVWGNLLEIKKELGPKGVTFPLPSGDKRLSNVAFDVCIEEYGAKVPRSEKWPEGWQRMFRMAKTTIME